MIGSILVLGFLIFGAIVYAVSKGYSVRAALKWLGASLIFEAQKNNSAIETRDIKVLGSVCSREDK